MVHVPFFTRIMPFIFPFLFSACVSQQVSPDFDKQQAAKARVELALGYLQQGDFLCPRLLFGACGARLFLSATGRCDSGRTSLFDCH